MSPPPNLTAAHFGATQVQAAMKALRVAAPESDRVLGALLERGFRQMIYKPAPAIFGQQFDESDLRGALAEYASRRRRFGGR